MSEKIRIQFTTDSFDQWRLSQVGGYIERFRGKEVFAFDRHDQYMKYLQLNTQRKE
ncbi:hypothetical protein [Paenibacillus larvae]|uniref:hypothetical protein n=1 Tax=Paenibacillus larvae TaxID=1464 RepID=UPI0013140904|nr:hypothetical protein [Paenibacillus larvae]